MNQLQQTRATRQISRPLKVLIPLIKDELRQGAAAGLEHYRRAGEMLIEAKEQLSYGSWTQWLTRNFELSKRTAQYYMRIAHDHEDSRTAGSQVPYGMKRITDGLTQAAETVSADQEPIAPSGNGGEPAETVSK